MRNKTRRTLHPDEFHSIIMSFSKKYRHWAADIIFFEQCPTDNRKGHEKEWHEFRLKWGKQDSWLSLSPKILQREFDRSGYEATIGNNTDKYHFRKTNDGMVVGARRRE